MTGSTGSFDINSKEPEVKENPMMEDSWSRIEIEKRKQLEQELSTLKEEETKKKKKLEQELLTLKKREMYRKYTSLISLVPFALLMANEFIKVYSDSVLLSVISVGLGHTLLPFSVLSLVCTLYLIYNNRRIVQKERELESIEDGRKVEKKKCNRPDIDQCLIYIEVISAVLVIVSQVMGEVSPLEAAEEALFFTASILSFAISFYNYKQESREKETEKSSHGEGFSKKISDMPIAGMMLAGSSLMLMRRVMLMALASSLSPAVGPALGLAAIALLMVGSGLVAHSYKRELMNIKVEGKGAATGVGGIGDNARNGYNSTSSGIA